MQNTLDHPSHPCSLQWSFYVLFSCYKSLMRIAVLPFLKFKFGSSCLQNLNVWQYICWQGYGKAGFSYIVGGNEKCYDSYGGKLGISTKTICVFILYSTTWPLGMYLIYFQQCENTNTQSYLPTNTGACICNIVYITHIIQNTNTTR